jgi:hypothetical protein
MELPPIETTARSGDETFTVGGAPAGLRLMKFWRWALSELVTKANRGLLDGRYRETSGNRLPNLPTGGVRRQMPMAL